MNDEKPTIKTVAYEDRFLAEKKLLAENETVLLQAYLEPAVVEVLAVFCNDVSDAIKDIHKQNLLNVVLHAAKRLYVKNDRQFDTDKVIFSEYYSYFAKKYTDYHFPAHEYSVALADGEYIEWAEQAGYIKPD